MPPPNYLMDDPPEFIISGDGIPEHQRTICYLRWKGVRRRCIGRLVKIDEKPSTLEFSQHCLPGLEEKNGFYSLEFKAARLPIRKDPSGSAAWICDEELDADGLTGEFE